MSQRLPAGLDEIAPLGDDVDRHHDPRPVIGRRRSQRIDDAHLLTDLGIGRAHLAYLAGQGPDRTVDQVKKAYLVGDFHFGRIALHPAAGRATRRGYDDKRRPLT